MITKNENFHRALGSLPLTNSSKQARKPIIAPSLLGEQQRFSISSVGSSGVLSQPETVVVPMSENVAVHDIDRSVSNHVPNLGTM